MLNTLLTSVSDKTRTAGMPEATLYALLGFVIVFLGIFVLIFVVWTVGKIMTAKNVSKTASKPQPVKDTVTVNVAPANESEEIPEETVAVITAAIMTYYQQTQPKCEFTVKRIKRI